MPLIDTAQYVNGGWYDRDGRAVEEPDALKVDFNITASGDIIAAVAAKKIRVLALILNASAAMSAQFQSNATTNKGPTFYLAANGGSNLPVNKGGWFETASGEKLSVVQTGAGNLSGTVIYVLAP